MTTPAPIAQTLGQFVAGFDAARVDAAVRRAALRCILDATGVAIAGSRQPAIAALRAAVIEDAGTGPATIWGGATSTPPGAACLLNGAAGHVLDFDDTCFDGIVHGSAVVWPAVLAAAQRQNLSGFETLSAFIAGVEAEYALGRAVGETVYWRGWWNTAVLGAIGAAAGAARALRLDPTATAHAIAIAAGQPAGIRGIFGSDAKPYVCGRAAQAGYEAARAAQAGLTAPADIFEAERGVLAMLGADRDDAATIADGLGRDFALVSPGIAFKLYPACSAAQAAAEICAAFRSQTGITPDEIAAVDCAVSPLVDISLRYDTPQTPAQAQFSLPFAVATSLIDGGMTIDHLHPSTLADPRLRRTMAKVRRRRDDDLAATAAARRDTPEGAHIVITTADGRRWDQRLLAATGMPVNPVSDERLDAKFLSCAGRALAPDAAAALLDRLHRLDRLETVRTLAPRG